MKIKFNNADMTDFDKQLFIALKEIYDMAKASGDILSETRMSRALYAFNLPPDECCIIRKARKEDIKEEGVIN